MHAESIKNWTAAAGDYSPDAESDYEQRFKMARASRDAFRKRLTVVLGIMALGAIVLVFEMMTRI